jgi:hypothetical protein
MTCGHWQHCRAYVDDAGGHVAWCGPNAGRLLTCCGSAGFGVGSGIGSGSEYCWPAIRMGRHPQTDRRPSTAAPVGLPSDVMHAIGLPSDSCSLSNFGFGGQIVVNLAVLGKTRCIPRAEFHVSIPLSGRP